MDSPYVGGVSRFFQNVETSPLNASQSRAVVNGEDSVLVLAGAGSGKTSVLVARAGWLLRRNEALPEQILLLAFGRQAADEMNSRIKQRLGVDSIKLKLFMLWHYILSSKVAARHRLSASLSLIARPEGRC